jgi:DNA polymerase-3 subunit beta
MSVDDYPELPSMPTSAGVVSGATFASAVSQVAIAASSDETINFLTGIRLELNGPTMTLAATDRYRLAVRELPWAPESPNVDAAALVPARILADTAKTLAAQESVVIALAGNGQDEGLLGIHGGGRNTTTRLLGGEFPKYRTLLPAESSTVAYVDTSALVDAVKRVSLVAERNTPVRLRFSGDEVDLRAGGTDEAQAVEALDAGVDGDEIEIAFNPRFLLDGLAVLDAPVVRFSFTVASKPAVMSGAAERGADASPEFRYLLMPVRLSG